MPDPGEDSEAWLSLTREWPKAFKTLAKKLAEGSAGVDLAMGVVAEIATPPPACTEADREWICYECGQTQKSYHGLQTHRMKEHDYVHPAQAYADGATCRACLCYFHERFRLVRHLREGKACLQWLTRRSEPMPTEERKERMKHDAWLLKESKKEGYLRPHAKCRAFRLPGPMPHDLPATISGRRDRIKPPLA